MKKVYKFTESFHRMGTLESVFVADEEVVARLRERGKLRLGEVLGKHSNITVTVNEQTLTEIPLGDETPLIVEFLEKHLWGCVGVDLIEYVRDLERDEKFEEQTRSESEAAKTIAEHEDRDVIESRRLEENK